VGSHLDGDAAVAVCHLIAGTILCGQQSQRRQQQSQRRQQQAAAGSSRTADIAAGVDVPTHAEAGEASLAATASQPYTQGY
jgi:hypothetical protein